MLTNTIDNTIDNTINKTINKLLLIVVFVMLLIPFTVNAVITTKTQDVINTFTIAPTTVTTYTVTYNNGNYSYTGGLTVQAGATYTSTITPNNNYTITGATVTMGGNTVNNAFSGNQNGGTLTINNVTGNININITTQYNGGGICLAEGTKVTLWNGTTKNIEDITYDDLLKVWNHDQGKYGYEYPAWIEKEDISDNYIKVTFSDGTVLKVIGNHSIFSKTLNKYVDINSTEFNVGDEVVKLTNGISYVKVTNIERVYEEVKYYHVISSRYFNIITNGLLTTFEIYNNISNFMGFGENLVWLKQEEVRSDMYTYDNFLYLFRYIYKTFRLQETKYLIENNIVTIEQFKELFENYLMNDQRKVSPPTNESNDRLWMVTTSDDLDPNDISHRLVEGSSYIVPTPNNRQNFLYWYNHSDNMNYNPGDVITVDSSIYLEAIYE